MQNRRDLLLGASGWRVEQVRGEGHQGPECLLDDGRQDVGLLAESKPAEPSQPAAWYIPHRQQGKGTHRNARTISSTTTVPAPTSRMLLLARRALTPSSSSGHLSGKSFEMSVLSVLASWTVITREGDVARSGRMLLFRAARSVGKIGL